jgi:hypothetical protein
MNQEKLDLSAIHEELIHQNKMLFAQNKMIDEGIDIVALLLITFLVCWLMKTAYTLYHNWSERI